VRRTVKPVSVSMKFYSLLLSSAAVLVAGAAAAADLPAKKAAPAAAPSAGCPAFGAGYIVIPGTDTCLKITGYIRADDKYVNESDYTRPSKANYSLGYKYQVEFIVKNNTEFGTVTSQVGILDSSSQQNTNHTAGSPTTDNAFVEFAGLKAGFAADILDFDNAYNNSGLAYQPTGTGQIGYTAQLGSTALTFGAESTQWSDSNGNTTTVASRPDLMIAAKSKWNDTVSTMLGLVSHEVNGTTSGSAQGFAALGRMDLNFAPAKLIVNAGYGQGANGYLDNPSVYGVGKAMGGVVNDAAADASNLSTANMVEGQLEYALGKNTLYGYGGQINASQDTNHYKMQIYGVGFKYVVAPGLYIRPELYHTDQNKNAAKDITADVAYLRIRRDF
jgi:Porin subfamily